MDFEECIFLEKDFLRLPMSGSPRFNPTITFASRCYKVAQWVEFAELIREAAKRFFIERSAIDSCAVFLIDFAIIKMSGNALDQYYPISAASTVKVTTRHGTYTLTFWRQKGFRTLILRKTFGTPREKILGYHSGTTPSTLNPSVVRQRQYPTR